MAVTKGLDILVYVGADSNKKAIGGQNDQIELNDVKYDIQSSWHF